MGTVYRADDLKLGQAVALKFLPANMENDAGRLQRLLSDVKIAWQILRHLCVGLAAAHEQGFLHRDLAGKIRTDEVGAVSERP